MYVADWGKLFTSRTTVWCPEYINASYNPMAKNAENSIKISAVDLKRRFSKADIQLTNKPMKKRLKSLKHQEYESKTQ